jgi:hypothetical protein
MHKTTATRHSTEAHPAAKQANGLACYPGLGHDCYLDCLLRQSSLLAKAEPILSFFLSTGGDPDSERVRSSTVGYVVVHGA